MVSYEALLAEADAEQLTVKEKPLRAHDGRIKGNRIAIRQDMTTDQKACVLAEELGHYYTSYGNIMDQGTAANRKQELRARVWAYKKTLDPGCIVQAVRHGCHNYFEVAEYLDVTEAFLLDALHCYREKYGPVVRCGSYLLYFDPLAVLDMVLDVRVK